MADCAAWPLPLTLAEITPEWLTRALRTRTQKVTVNGVEVVDVNNGTCTKVRLRLDLDDAGKAAGIPELVILKGGFEPHSRVMAHVHLSEVRGYRDVFPYVSLPTPRCFFADFSEEQQQGVVIMEDLCELGVEFCNALRPQSFDQVARRLSVLAEFHAQTWGVDSAMDGRFADFKEGELALRTYMDQYLLQPEEWQRFVASPRGAATSVHFHDLAKVIDRFDRLVAFARRHPACLNHGDTHLNNLFIFPDGTPGFFDALPGKAPGMREVTYHLTCALDIADRQRWDGALVQHYLAELQRHGVDAPGFDDAMQQYAAFLLNGYIIFMVNESFYQPESANTAYAARFSQAMIDHRTMDVLAAVPI